MFGLQTRPPLDSSLSLFGRWELWRGKRVFRTCRARGPYPARSGHGGGRSALTAAASAIRGIRPPCRFTLPSGGVEDGLEAPRSSRAEERFDWPECRREVAAARGLLEVGPDEYRHITNQAPAPAFGITVVLARRRSISHPIRTAPSSTISL
jgi:hypothetical protein